MYLVRALKSRAVRWALIAAVLAGITSYTILINILKQETVVIVKRRIEEGEIVKKEDLIVKGVPISSINERAIQDLQSVAGKKIRVTRLPGDQLTEDNLQIGEEDKRSRKPGNVIMSLNVRDYQPLSEYITEDDLISIVAISQYVSIDKQPVSTVLKGIKLIEAKKREKDQDQQKADTVLLLEVPIDLAERIIALESKSYFKAVVDGGD